MSIRVRLTRKFAQILNGIDLSRTNAGEILELSSFEAELLIAEGWASLIDTAHDTPKPRTRRVQTGAARN